mmetsp:Transcript_35745/g.83173  ORF Transcript_35745/g.83173 Transcript_35745/m.83173 type:complete len:355 (+) Transcript_35745:268-1332(+)
MSRLSRPCGGGPPPPQSVQMFRHHRPGPPELPRIVARHEPPPPRQPPGSRRRRRRRRRRRSLPLRPALRALRLSFPLGPAVRPRRPRLPARGAGSLLRTPAPRPAPLSAGRDARAGGAGVLAGSVAAVHGLALRGMDQMAQRRPGTRGGGLGRPQRQRRRFLPLPQMEAPCRSAGRRHHQRRHRAGGHRGLLPLPHEFRRFSQGPFPPRPPRSRAPSRGRGPFGRKPLLPPGRPLPETTGRGTGGPSPVRASRKPTRRCAPRSATSSSAPATAAVRPGRRRGERGGRGDTPGPGRAAGRPRAARCHVPQRGVGGADQHHLSGALCLCPPRDREDLLARRETDRGRQDRSAAAPP